MDAPQRQAEDSLSTHQGMEVLIQSAASLAGRISFDVRLLILAGLIACGSFVFGERVAIRDGLGWDGEIYWNWVKDFPGELREYGIDAYRIQRVLPSCILYGSFRALGIAPTIDNTLIGFAVLNVISIVLLIHFWCLTANHLRITDRGKWLGFVGLMLNFAVLKCSGYDVALVDMPAYASGAAMAYCYLTDRQFGLILTTVIGAFLWPTQLAIGTLLSLFPRTKGDPAVTIADLPLKDGRHAPWRLDLILAALAAYYSCLWSLYVCQRIQMPLFGGLFPIRMVQHLSLMISASFVFFALRPLLDDRSLYRWPKFSRSQQMWAVAALLVAIGVKLLQSGLSNRPGYFGLANYLLVVGLSAAAKPGIFLLSHLIYFGPLWLLAGIFWPSVCRRIHRQHGLGLTLAIAIGVCHALDAESRHLVYLVPLLIPFVVQAIDQLQWTKNRLIFMTGLSILASKCWMTIGGPFTDNANAFPDQLFWMNIGTFMSDQTYVWQLIAACVCAWLLHEVVLRDNFIATEGANHLSVPGNEQEPTDSRTAA